MTESQSITTGWIKQVYWINCIFAYNMATKKQTACLSKEFNKLKKKKTMAKKQKVAIALSVCKVGKNKKK